MPGLVGSYSKHALPEELLHGMTREILHRQDYGTHHEVNSHFQVATVDLATNRQNYWAKSRDDRYRLVLFGTLYEDWAKDEALLAERLMQRWLKQGQAGLVDLNGEYIVLIYDSNEKKITVINDRLGLLRLYYWNAPDVFAFASELKSLAVIEELDRTVDERALAELLTFGHLQEDRSLFKNVKLLPPGSVLTWKEGEFEIKKYWEYEYKENPLYRDSKKASQTYYEVLSRALKRRIEKYKRVGVLLSGGFDSRTLAGIYRNEFPKRELFSWTCGHGHDHDTKYAKQIAKAVSSCHQSLNIPEEFLSLHGERYAWTLDGSVSMHGSHRSCAMEAVKNKVDAVIIGYLGDTVGGGKPIDQVYPSKSIEEVIKIGFNLFPQGFNNELFKKTMKPESYAKVKDFPFSVYEKTSKEARCEHIADRAVIAELKHRQRLWNPIAQMDLMNQDCKTLTPFADKEFVDFCLSLPIEQRLKKLAYSNMIKEKLPRLARIPLSGDGLPLVHSRIRASLHWRWELFKRNRLPKLSAGLYKYHNKRAFVHCAEWLRGANRLYIENEILKCQELGEHFKRETIKELVGKFMQHEGKRDYMDSVSALLSYAVFRRKLSNIKTISLKEQKYKLGAA